MSCILISSIIHEYMVTYFGCDHCQLKHHNHSVQLVCQPASQLCFSLTPKSTSANSHPAVLFSDNKSAPATNYSQLNRAARHLQIDQNAQLLQRRTHAQRVKFRISEARRKQSKAGLGDAAKAYYTNWRFFLSLICSYLKF